MQIKNTQHTPTDAELKENLRSFIHEHDPDTHYIFNNQKGGGVTELCRADAVGKDCIELKMDMKEMFKAMQEEGFFCSLPQDPERTDMYCKPFPRN